MEISGYAPFLTIKEREMPVFVPTVGNPKPQTVVKRPKGISDFMFLYTVKGEGICNIEGETFELKPGILLFVPPGEPHDYCMKDLEWETVYITFNGAAITDFLKDKSVICQISESFDFLSRYEKIYEYKQNPRYYKELSVAAYSLIVEMRELINDETVSERKGNIVEKAIRYMEKNKDFSLPEISRKTGVSEEHFCRIFKQYTGYRPAEYMNILKIQKAKRLLKEEGKSINDAAKEAGYESRSYFGMLFKKHIGMTPKEYKDGNFD